MTKSHKNRTLPPTTVYDHRANSPISLEKIFVKQRCQTPDKKIKSATTNTQMNISTNQGFHPSEK